MNPLNYASLEASKRLVEAGIVLETEAGWYKIFRPGCHSFDMVLSMRSGNEKFYGDNYPAPSMAEVWRELSKYLSPMHYCRIGSDTAGNTFIEIAFSGKSFRAVNPTDALIELLIWEWKEASHE